MPDQPSEWGKLNQGQTFVPFAMDVARAVFAVGLGEHQASLFWHVVEHCWSPARRGKAHSGYADSVGCTIKLAELSKLWGVPLPRLSTARKWLLDAKMIEERHGQIWVNKDAETWVHPGTTTPLLSPAKLAHAVAARTRSRKRDNQESVTVERNLELRFSVTDACESDGLRSSVSEVTVDRNQGPPEVTVKRNPNLRSTVSEVTVNRNGAHSVEPTRERVFQEQEDLGDGVPPDEFEAPQNNPKHVARVADAAEERWPAQNADTFVGDLCRTYPVAIVEEAMNRAYDKWPHLKRLDPPKRKWIRTACDGLRGDKWEPPDRASPRNRADPRPAPKPEPYFDPHAYLKDLQSK